ncbi:MAG: intermembrane phospholipid transport protein YdbH family protein [Arenicella sp.]
MLIIAVGLNLPRLLSWGIEQQLLKNGADNVHVTMDVINTRELSFNRLAFSLPYESNQARIDLKNIDIAYSLKQLWQGRIATVTVESADIDLQFADQKSAVPLLDDSAAILASFSTVKALRNMLAQNMAKVLPFEAVTINNIQVNSRSTETQQRTELELKVQKNADDVRLDLLWNQQKQIRLTFQQGDWQANVVDVEDNETTRLILGLQISPQGLLLDSNFDLMALQGWSSSVDKDLQDITAKDISLKVHLEMPGVSGQLSAELDWRIAAVTMAGLSIDDFTGSLPINVSEINGLWVVQTEVADIAARKLELSGHQIQSLTVGLNDATLQANSALIELDGILAIDVQKLETEDSLLVEGQALELSTKTQGKVQLRLADGRVDQHSFHLHLEPQWTLAVKRLTAADLQLPKGISIHSEQALDVRGNGRSFELLSPLPVITQIKSENLVLENMSMALKPWQWNVSRFAWTDQDLEITGKIDIPYLNISTTDNSFQIFQLQQQYSFDGEKIHITGTFDETQRGLQATNDLKHNLDSERGDAVFNLSDIVVDSSQRWQQLMQEISVPVDIVTGQVGVETKASWALKESSAPDINARIQLQDIGGVYDEIYFSGVQADLAMQLYPSIQTRQTQSLQIAAIDAGIPLTETVLDFSLDKPAKGDLPMLTIKHLRSSVLDGSVVVNDAVYDLDKPVNRLLVELDEVDVDRLVQLNQLDDIEATGRISGRLPVIVDQQGVQVEKGQLQSLKPGGVIRYLGDTEALEQNQLANIAVQVLKNFNYDDLQAETQYSQNGDLNVLLRLQGNNPDYESGREINLNINVQQNMLKLLESLRYVDGLNEVLDQRVQQFYQRTQ